MKKNVLVTHLAAVILTLFIAFNAFGQESVNNNPEKNQQAENNSVSQESLQNLFRRGRARAFDVTITNVTPISLDMTTGQPFSPPVIVAHNAFAPELFAVGQPASFGLMRIAEEGNTGPLSTAVIVPNQGILFGEEKIEPSILPGQSRSTVIYADRRFPLVSMVWMLVRTNDGFTGLDSINVFEFGSLETRTYNLVSYDAGTEVNNELNPFLIARQGTDRQPENSVVTTPHPNIRGDADAPVSWRFNPQLVAIVKIKALPRFSDESYPKAKLQPNDAQQSNK